MAAHTELGTDIGSYEILKPSQISSYSKYSHAHVAVSAPALDIH